MVKWPWNFHNPWVKSLSQSGDAGLKINTQILTNKQNQQYEIIKIIKNFQLNILLQNNKISKSLNFFWMKKLWILFLNRSRYNKYFGSYYRRWTFTKMQAAKRNTEIIFAFLVLYPWKLLLTIKNCLFLNVKIHNSYI